MSQSSGTLYIVATPIGNLGDVTFRARDILSSVEMICCEDTRVTAKLLVALEIKKKLVSIHEHSSERDLANVVDELLAGKNIALVTDAGTPGISDPGGKLIALAAASDVVVSPIPGPSAMVAALSIAGFATEPFTFFGFPPQKKGRQTFFSMIDVIDDAVVLYESTHRIEKTLAALPQDRIGIVCRELTKLHETVYRGTVAEIREALTKTSNKGEFVIVLAPKKWR